MVQTAFAYCAVRTEVFSYYLCELSQDKYNNAPKALLTPTTFV